MIMANILFDGQHLKLFCMFSTEYIHKSSVRNLPGFELAPGLHSLLVGDTEGRDWGWGQTRFGFAKCCLVHLLGLQNAVWYTFWVCKRLSSIPLGTLFNA